MGLRCYASNKPPGNEQAPRSQATLWVSRPSRYRSIGIAWGQWGAQPLPHFLGFLLSPGLLPTAPTRPQAHRPALPSGFLRKPHSLLPALLNLPPPPVSSLGSLLPFSLPQPLHGLFILYPPSPQLGQVW